MHFCKIEYGDKGKVKKVLLSIGVFFVILCLNIVFLTVYHTQFSSSHILEKEKEYRLVDLEVSTSAFIRNYNKVIALKKFYKELSNHTKFQYYESIIQPNSIFNFKGDEKFLYNYEDNLLSKEEKDSINEYQNIKQILINKNYANKVKLHKMIANGRGFRQGEFITKNYKEIPVILGADYMGIYKIGERIDGMPQVDVMATYRVIGFLKKDTSIVVNGELVFLDRYFVTPSLTILKDPDSLSDLMYQGFLYLQKSNGTISLSDSYSFQNFLNDLERLRIKYNVFDIGVLNYSMLELNSLKMLVYENIEMLVSIGIILFIFSCISIGVYMILIIQSLLYVYRVYLLSGYSIREIQRSMCMKLFQVIWIPVITAMLVGGLFLREFLFELVIFDLVLLVIFFIFSLLLIWIYFRYITLEKLLKGDYND